MANEDSRTSGVPVPEFPLQKISVCTRERQHDVVTVPMMSRKGYFSFAGIVCLVGYLPSEPIARELN